MVVSLQCLVSDRTKMPVAQEAGKEIDKQVAWRDWHTYFENDTRPDRKILLKVYTDWCTWCRRMEEQTFSAPHIATFINEKFYPVKFNAETKEDIVYKGKTYYYVKDGKRGHHELAATLLQGRMSYPTLVFIDEEGELIQCIVGFKTAEEFEMILAYFYGNYYKKKPWSAFKRDYPSMRIVKD